MTAVRAGFLLAAIVVVVVGCDRGSSGTAADPCPEFASRSDVGGSGAVQGQATYGKPVITGSGLTGDVVVTPIRYAGVEVVSCQSGAVVASGATDAGGRFLVSFSNPGRVGVYVRILSSSPRYAVSVRRSPAEPFLYGIASAGVDDAGDGEIVTVSGVETIDPTASGVFNIFEQGIRGAETVESLAGSAPTVPVVWYWYPGNPNGTGYTSETRAITVLGSDDDSDEFDDPVLLHEYGHFVLDVYSRDDSPGGPHFLGDSSLDLRLAWSEGWATFFSSAVRNDPRHIDTGGGAVLLSFNIETPSFGTATRYDSNELAIAAVLWDAHDADDADEGAGALNGLLASIWSVSRGLSAAPVTFEDFWSGWQAENLSDLRPILADRQIDLWPDGHEAGANDNDPSRATPITLFSGANSSAIQHHTLYPAGDVDYAVFTTPGSGTFSVATSRCSPAGDTCDARVSNGADTLLSVIGVTPASSADNLNGRTYSPSCVLTACPPNDAETLSSKVTVTAMAAGMSYVIRISRSPSAPPSAAETGSYDLVVTEEP